MDGEIAFVPELPDVEAGLRRWQEALQDAPDSGLVHHHLAEALLLHSQYEDAIAHYREASRLMPLLKFAHSGAGYGLFEMHRWDEAIAEYEAELRLQPEEPRVLYGLAQAHYEKASQTQARDDWQKAREALERVLATEPDSAAVRRQLAWACWWVGDRPEAIRLMEGAAKMVPNASDELHRITELSLVDLANMQWETHRWRDWWATKRALQARSRRRDSIVYNTPWAG